LVTSLEDFLNDLVLSGGGDGGQGTSASSQTVGLDFTRDVLGRYLCNGFDEAARSADRSVLGPDGSRQSDARPFDVIVIGGGTFGAAVAQHIFASDKTRSHRVLVLEAGVFALPEHVQNLPMLGLAAPGPVVSDRGLRSEVWGLPWNTTVGQGFPGLAYLIGGRSVFWGGWSPELLDIAEDKAKKIPADTEMPRDRWPGSVVTELTEKPGYFAQASAQIGVSATNDFIFGALHNALRQQLFSELKTITNALPLDELPDHPAIRHSGAPKPSGAELAAMLGLPPTPPLPSVAELLSLMKLEAPLAVQTRAESGLFAVNKFSAVPLLTKAARAAQSEAEQVTTFGLPDVNKRLMVVPKCHVKRLITAVGANGTGRVSAVDTEYGQVPVNAGAVVIIALGTIESTRLALESFRGITDYGRIGQNLIAHLRSNLTIRVPRASLENSPALSAELKKALKEANLEASALFLKGRVKLGGQFRHFHLQITASGLGSVGTDSEAELFKKIPDIDGFAAFEAATRDHVVITIRGIGEMEPDVPGNQVTSDLNPNRHDFNVRKAFVELGTTDNDNKLWDAMDEAADQVAMAFAAGEDYEVLFPPQASREARPVKAGKPPKTVLPIEPFSPRRDGLGTTHHEAGTLKMGENSNSSVTNPDGRFHNVENVYVVGPALFPTTGSPNPMLTGIALARRTAEKLLLTLPHFVAPDLDPKKTGFEYLFDGTQGMLSNWDMVGGGQFALIDGKLIAHPGSGGIGLLYYAAKPFENFILRLEFLLPRPRGDGNDNSGVFVRFRHPRRRVPEGNFDPNAEKWSYDNQAFVAVHTGFEIQIDEEARGDKSLSPPEPDGFLFNRTGAIYKVPLGKSAGQQDYTNNQNLAADTWQRYEIEVKDDTYTVRLNDLPATTFVNTDKNRGKPPSKDPASGYIGIQTHTGLVQFRNIRIKRI
jgi:hypothetical protein